jgi:nucleoid-associated protein YgaU
MKLERPNPRIAALVVCACIAPAPASASAAVASSNPAGAPRALAAEPGASSLESAAAKAGNAGRAVAMSLIGLAFAVAGTVLAFRRDFKEAAGVFAVGIVSVLLATPAGVSLLRDTVTSLFGSP